MTGRIEHLAEGVTCYLGDCRELLGSIGRVDAIITDPPYGTTACEWDCVPDLELLWRALKNICSGSAVIFGAQPFVTDLIQSNRGQFKYDLIWRKSNVTGFLNAGNAPLRQHEHVLLFDLGAAKYRPQMWKKSSARTAQKTVNANGVYGAIGEGVFRKESDENGFPRSVLDYNTAYHERNAGLHPTQKPEGLTSYLVSTYTDEADTILDPFCGSGTTGAAAVKLGRKFIGIEKHEPYFDLLCRRISEALKQPDLFIERPAPAKQEALL